MEYEFKEVFTQVWKELAPAGLVFDFRDGETIKVSIMDKDSNLKWWDSTVAAFSVSFLPGVAVIRDAYVVAKHQGKKWGQQFAHIRAETFRRLRANPWYHDDVIAVVNKDNAKQQHILRKVGWTQHTDTIWSLPK